VIIARDAKYPFVPSEVEGPVTDECLDFARHERAWMQVRDA
jgi:hypothetical protein